MSWKASAWAKSTRGHRNASQKLVLMVLADYHSEDRGYAWPSVETLASDCEIHRSSVHRHLHSLSEQGFISIIGGQGDRHRNNAYVLNFDVVEVNSSKTRQLENDASVQDDTCQNENLIDASVQLNSRTDTSVTNSNQQLTDNEPSDEEQTSSIDYELQPFDDRLVAIKDSGAPHTDILSASYIKHLQEKYGDRLSPARIDDEITGALNHAAYKKASNKLLYVTRWVGRAHEHTFPTRRQSQNGHGSGRTRRVEPTSDRRRYGRGEF